ncbi:MAG: cell division protein FtsZ [Cytophagales bacterium]
MNHLNISYRFDIQAEPQPIIKVIGVGGGGSNAVNHMYNMGIKEVSFVICNTDLKHLKKCTVPTKIQLGVNLTQGNGTGTKPEVGKSSALESKEEIRNMLAQDTKMVFITAGMGGGTGTGAAPVIAKIAKELDILTVGIVTVPFNFEGPIKRKRAEEGLKEMKQYCDTVLVILNDKISEVYGNLPVTKAFTEADNVLATAAKSISEIITYTREQNVDYNDVRTVLEDAGDAVMGTGMASGENRAKTALQRALSSPLLNNTEVKGAKNILLSITYGPENPLTMDEYQEITNHLYGEAGYEAEMKAGLGEDPELGDKVSITVIATGFERQDDQQQIVYTKTVYDLESNQKQKIVETNQVTVVNNPILETNQPIISPKENYASYSREENPIIDPNSQYKIKENKASQTLPIQQSLFDEFIDPAQHDRMAIEQQKRMERLRQVSNKHNPNAQWSSLSPEELKNRNDIPAYLRKGSSLVNIPPSSERTISRFNLNDDNELLGNNKFLHDNVD